MDITDSITIPVHSAVASLPKSSRRLAITAICIGLFVLLGWLTGIEVLKSVLPGLTTMKVNTAITIVLLGLGVFYLRSSAAFSRLIVTGSALIALLIVSATACEYLFQINLRLDNLLIADDPKIMFPGRMAPASICCFALLGTALMMTQLKWQVAIAQAIFCIAVGVSLTTLGGYLYGAPLMLVHAPYPVVAVHTAVAIILLSIGALIRTPDEGLMKVVVADTTGGWVARRLIPTAVFIPMVVGFAVVMGQRAGLYGVAFAVALTVSADVTLITASVWWVSEMLNTADAIRLHTQRVATQAEARFRELSDAMPQIVWTARPDGTIDYYNERWYEFTGFDRALIGDQSWEPVLHPDDLARTYTVYYAAIRSGTPYQIDVRLLDKKTQRYRWYLARALPTRDPAGKIVRWYGTTTDIDEQKQAVEDRRIAFEAERAARAEAERQSVLKDNFLATLSHELRTPLNAILGWSSLLNTRTDMNEEIRDGVCVIERNARAQAQIVEDLLDMSRIISGKLRLAIEPVDLRSVIQTAMHTARLSAEAKNVRIDLEVDPGSVSITGDPSRLLQVCWNLLSNAIKFTPAGGWVKIKLALVNNHMQLVVQDNGKGITADFLPHLFGRFRQADSGTSRRFGGLGLGLSIVRQLVELHGGTIRAQSDGEGKGSTFTATFPLVANVEPETLQPLPVRKSDPASDYRLVDLNLVRVLIVDDEPDSLTMMQHILEQSHACVMTASSVEAALALLEDQPVDILISDIGMPGKTGYDLIRSIRESGNGRIQKIPAAAVTAYVRSEDRVRVLQAGFQMHVHKPVIAEELITTAASLARRI